MRTLSGRTMIMSGGSRGIGFAIALRAARDGANVTLLAKTDQPHPKLEGTVHTAAAAIEAAGGQALAVVGDVREEADVVRAVAATVERFGGLDIVVNNASALNLTPTTDLPMKAYDLMQAINTRGTFLLSQKAIPHLVAGQNPHILTLSPPLDLDPRWFGGHLAYTISKYGMSMCTLGLAAELADRGVAANSLWPRTMIATAAVRNLLPGNDDRTRDPSIMADAAHAILVRDSAECTGNFFVDDDVLRAQGITDLDAYRSVPGDTELAPDIFLG